MRAAKRCCAALVHALSLGWSVRVSEPSTSLGRWAFSLSARKCGWSLTEAIGGAVIHVFNENFADVRVFLLRGSMPIRLGTVGSFEKRSFQINPAVVGSGGTVTLVVQPIGYESLTLEPVAFTAGEALELRVGTNIVNTYLTPRIRR